MMKGVVALMLVVAQVHETAAVACNPVGLYSRVYSGDRGGSKSDRWRSVAVS